MVRKFHESLKHYDREAWPILDITKHSLSGALREGYLKRANITRIARMRQLVNPGLCDIGRN